MLKTKQIYPPRTLHWGLYTLVANRTDDSTSIRVTYPDGREYVEVTGVVDADYLFPLIVQVSQDPDAFAGQANLLPRDFRVSWEIDVFQVRTPRQAAERARDYQVREGTTATVFRVMPADGTGEPAVVDLMEAPSQ